MKNMLHNWTQGNQKSLSLKHRELYTKVHTEQLISDKERIGFAVSGTDMLS